MIPSTPIVALSVRAGLVMEAHAGLSKAIGREGGREDPREAAGEGNRDPFLIDQQAM
jgi:hypothetical protein